MMPTCRSYTLPVTIILMLCLAMVLYKTSLEPGDVQDRLGYASDQSAAFVDRLKTLMRFNSGTSRTDETLPGDVPEASDDVYRKFKKYVFPKNVSTQIFRCLDVVHDIANTINMTWWIASGTLIGSYRHHGMIPWDGDIDIVADPLKKDEFRQEFKSRVKSGVINDVRIDTQSFPWDKVHAYPGHKPEGEKPAKRRRKKKKKKILYRTPFVDVFWYTNNGSHCSATYNPTVAWKQLLPLVKRPLAGRLVPAPRDPRDYLTRYYGNTFDSRCETGGFDYLNEKEKPWADRGSVPCAALVNRFPFVRHTRGPGGSYCKEELMIGGRVLSSFVRSAKNIPMC